MGAGAFWGRCWTDAGVGCRLDRCFFVGVHVESSKPASSAPVLLFPEAVRFDFDIGIVGLFGEDDIGRSNGYCVVRIPGGARASAG